jgi:hypothetical protein
MSLYLGRPARNITYRTLHTSLINRSSISPLTKQAHRQQAALLSTKHATQTSMASSKFYDFKPLDSTSSPHPLQNASSLTLLYRFSRSLTRSTEKGQPFPTANLTNKVVLIFNSASKCGFTPQLEGLEKLYKEIKSDAQNGEDFEMIGFPCNQFGGQDPGSNEEIQEFCMVNYGVTFKM